MTGYNIFFNNRYEHQQKFFYCDFCIEYIVHLRVVERKV